ncbi:hypothetical protein [Planctomicrobium piriforme]|uniref:Uncharacterized protein n=1 Tax=Planctomicrobium piriforme TaxID=1576369 RepID=A0A1I3E727_9PLAN|nr:hypothetical protein [Planctomicrobium piriforme]SFH94755.1 hypothetical protein SAMN05421753_104105 [Planctomicrobium piriforme]
MSFRPKYRPPVLLMFVVVIATFGISSGSESAPDALSPPMAEGVTFVEVSPPDIFPYLLKGRYCPFNNRYLGRDERFYYIQKSFSDTVYYCRCNKVGLDSLRIAQDEQESETERFLKETATLDIPLRAYRPSKSVPAWAKKAGLDTFLEPVFTRRVELSPMGQSQVQESGPERERR